MGKEKKEQKRLQEERMNEILSRLDSIENAVNENKQAVNENKQSVEDNSVKIETTTAPTDEEKQVAAEETDIIDKEMEQAKKLSPDQEFDLLLTKLTTQTGKYEPRLNSINRGSENALKNINGGLQLAILLLRAEDNLNKISLNETWDKNINGIRRNSIILSLVKAVEETGDRMRSQGGVFRANAVIAKESFQNKTSSALDGVRGAFGWDKKNRSELGNDAYQNIGAPRDTSKVNMDNNLGGGGRKTQRRKKHKKSGKHHKTRKHH